MELENSQIASNCIKLLNCWGVILHFRARTRNTMKHLKTLHLLWFKYLGDISLRVGWSCFLVGPLLYPTTGHAWICTTGASGAIGASPTEGQDGEFLPKAAVGFDDLSGKISACRFTALPLVGFIEPLETLEVHNMKVEWGSSMIIQIITGRVEKDTSFKHI